MIQIDPESEFSLAQAAKLLPGKPSPTSVWRWTKRGVRVNGVRVRLRAIRLGGKIVVTGTALLDFLQAQQFDLASPSGSSARPHKRGEGTAEAELEALGA